MRRFFICVSAMLFVGCGNLFDRNVVARAGGNELTAEWFVITSYSIHYTKLYEGAADRLTKLDYAKP